jgi:hypothetical protein
MGKGSEKQGSFMEKPKKFDNVRAEFTSAYTYKGDSIWHPGCFDLKCIPPGELKG